MLYSQSGRCFHGSVAFLCLKFLLLAYIYGQQVIFPTQGSNPGLLHCRQILYQLSHKGSPRILEWVAFPFSRGSFRPRNRTRVSCIADFLPIELSGKPVTYYSFSFIRILLGSYSVLFYKIIRILISTHTLNPYLNLLK